MTFFFQGVVAFMLLLSLVSCQSDKMTESVTGTGTLRLYATDAPFNFDTVSSARVSIDEIRLRTSGGEKVSVMDKSTTLDLMTLRNGLVETLSEIEIPSGKYDEIFLVISSALVEMKDGRIFPLKVPSGPSSGLKVFVKPDISITTGMSTDVLLDFDLSQSFVPMMNGKDVGAFIFRPVIKATALAWAGTISGQVLDVTDDKPIPGATVTVKKGAEIMTTAITDSEGFFKILGVPAETYHVVAEAVDFGSLTIESVPVTVGNEVTTHFILTPMASPL
jgi:Domain of unknown function (DUF4382)/Carboxypeptidase regulatory-like domain